MNSIGTLLQAAEYLERREREHGYASSRRIPVHSSMRKKASSKQRKSQGSRSSHNELEKNRRAQLQYFLEQLKRIVPLAPDSSRHTTLRLLTDAQSLIRSLEERERQHRRARDQLLREQRSLRLLLARTAVGTYRSRVEHSLSECSTTSSGSASSFLSTSDDADITSCSSGGFSDSEELGSSSIQDTLSGLAIVSVDRLEL